MLAERQALSHRAGVGWHLPKGEKCINLLVSEPPPQKLGYRRHSEDCRRAATSESVAEFLGLDYGAPCQGA